MDVTAPLAPGVVYTLWTGGDLAHVLTDAAKRDLATARPGVVSIHAGPDRLVAAAAGVAAGVRAILPDARLWLGIGLDVWEGRALHGQLAQARAHVTAAVDLAAALGCEAICWDPELEGPVQLEATIARAWIGDARARHPALVQCHTSYDHPTLHASAYPWAAWCGPGGVDVELPQVYPALEHPVGPGALQARLATSRASYATAVRLGWVRPELVGQAIYLQLHGVPAADTVAVGRGYGLVAGWVSELIDDDGRRALRELCELARAAASG